VSGDAYELLAMLLDWSLAKLGYALLCCLGWAVMKHLVVPALVSAGKCVSAWIEALWMPPRRRRRGRGRRK
jgi:hypothetical protein